MPITVLLFVHFQHCMPLLFATLSARSRKMQNQGPAGLQITWNIHSTFYYLFLKVTWESRWVSFHIILRHQYLIYYYRVRGREGRGKNKEYEGILSWTWLKLHLVSHTYSAYWQKNLPRRSRKEENISKNTFQVSYPHSHVINWY